MYKFHISLYCTSPIAIIEPNSLREGEDTLRWVLSVVWQCREVVDRGRRIDRLSPTPRRIEYSPEILYFRRTHLCTIIISRINLHLKKIQNAKMQCLRNLRWRLVFRSNQRAMESLKLWLSSTDSYISYLIRGSHLYVDPCLRRIQPEKTNRTILKIGIFSS